MTASLLTLLLAAAPIRVAAPGLETTGLDATLGAAYLDRYVSLLEGAGPIKVTTSRDLQQVLGLERQRALLGCGDDGACLAEMSAALGVDAMVSGSLAHAGRDYLITLRAINAKNGSVITTESGRLQSESELNDWLDASATKMASSILTAFGRGAELISRAPEAPARWPRYVPAAVGGAAAITGAVLWGLSARNAGVLTGDVSKLTPDEIKATASQGAAFQVAGPVLIGVGLAGIATTVVWSMLDVPVTATVAPVGGGGGIVLVGGTF